MMNRLGITLKLTLIFAVFAGGVLLGLGIPVYNNARNALKAATFSELLTTTLEKQSALESWVTEKQQSIGDIAGQAYLQESVTALLTAGPGLSDANLAYTNLVTDLKNWAGTGHQFLLLDVIEATDGRVIASTNAVDEGKIFADQLFFINGLQNAYVENPYYDLASQSPIMTAAAPILSPDGRVVAVLAGRLNMGEMNAIIQRRSGLHQSDDAFLVNTSNLFVTQPRLISDPAVLLRGIHTEAINDCLAHTSGVIAAPDYRNIPAFIMYRWLPDRQLCLIDKIDQTEALAPARALASTMAWIGGLVFLIGALVAYGLSRSITKPVRALVQGVKKISEGDLDTRIEVKSGDELGKLGLAFNQMAVDIGGKETQLRMRTSELERHVTELNALNSVAAIINQSMNVDEILNRAMDESLNLVGVRSATMFLLDEAAGELVLTATRNIPDDIAKGLNRIKLDDFLPGRAMQTGKPVIMSHAAEYDGKHADIIQRERIQSMAAVPLIGRAGSIGVMTLSTTQTEYFDAAGLDLLVNIGRQIAIGIEKARLYQETHDLVNQLEQRVDERTRELQSSEGRYRTLSEASPDLIFVIDRQDKVQYVNTVAARQFGKTPEQVIGKARTELFPPALADNQTASLQQVLISAEPLLSESSIAFPGGKLWLETQLVPLRNEAGEVTSVMGVSRDVTERKQSDEAVREAKERFQALFEQASDGIFLADNKGRYIEVNTAGCRLLGYTKKEILEKTLNDLTKVSPAEPIRFEELQLGKTIFSYREMIRKDGTLMPVEISAKQYADGTLQGIVRDITERKAADDALRESEARFRRLLEMVPLPLCHVDKDGTIIFRNERFVQVFGYTAEDVPTLTEWWLRAYPDSQYRQWVTEKWDSAIRRAAAEGRDIDPIEYIVTCKNGEERNIEISGITLGDEFLATFVDFTARKQTESALRDSEERFRATFEQAAVGIAQVGLGGRWLRVNQRLCDIVGYTAEELLPLTFQDITHPDDLNTDLDYVRQVLAGKIQTYSMEKRYIRKDRSQVWINLTVGLVRDEATAPKYFVSVVEDITERKKTEEKLKKVMDDLARSNAELERFAYVASHDLQEPLRMVTSYLQLLERRYKDKLDGDALEFINYAVDGSNRMKTLISDLLSYSRVGTRGKEFALTDCEEILGRVLDNLQISIEENRAKVTHDPLPKLMADDVQLESLFQNLIGNAIKFHGKKPPRVHVGVNKDEKGWIFSVSDNGIGIDPQYFERIFIIFQRLHNREEYPGTGIGLAISKRIVERHGGRMWIESQPGKGSTFFFTLPNRGESQ
jgi:PAS domain S-box-containing protein